MDLRKTFSIKVSEQFTIVNCFIDEIFQDCFIAIMLYALLGYMLGDI